MSVVKIAERAGVSIATVSRVLNNSRPVDPRIAEQVRRAMKELNFSPRKFRQRKIEKAAEKRLRTVALMTVGQGYRGWFEMPIIAATVGKILAAAQENGLGVLVTEMIDPTQLSPVVQRKEVDGALAFISGQLTPDAAAALRQAVPIVRVMGGQLFPADMDHVTSDNNAVGYLAGSHLLDQGCRTCLFVASRPGWDIMRLRVQGFAAALAARDTEPHCFLVGEAGHYRSFYGPAITTAPDMAQLVAQVAQKIRSERDEGPVGLFVPRDEETVEVYRELEANQISPGRDVIVVSCDNEDVRLSTLHPRPPSIDLVSEEIARQAVNRLMWRIENPTAPPVRLLVAPRLETRKQEPA